MELNFAAMEKYAIYFQQGVLYTVVLSLFTVAFGFVIALVLALIRIAKPGRGTGSKVLLMILQTFAKLYVEFIRGTPMLVQLYLMFYVVFGTMGVKAPQFTLFGFVQGDRLIPGIIALSLNSGAYVSEIIRAGIQGIDYGQTEAARSLGMTASQNMRYIVLPQAIKNILPAIANEFVTIIKESSICSVLGMQELMYNAKLVQGASFLPAEPLVIVTILYLCLTVPTSKVIQYFERRMSRGDKR